MMMMMTMIKVENPAWCLVVIKLVSIWMERLHSAHLSVSVSPNKVDDDDDDDDDDNNDNDDDDATGPCSI